MEEAEHNWIPGSHTNTTPGAHAKVIVSDDLRRQATPYPTRMINEPATNSTDRTLLDNSTNSNTSAIGGRVQTRSADAQGRRTNPSHGYHGAGRSCHPGQIARDALSQSPVTARPEVPKTPRTHRNMSDEASGLQTTAQAVLPRCQDGNISESERDIDPTLRSLMPTSHGTNSAPETRREGAESIPHGPLHSHVNRVMTSPPARSRDNRPTRTPTRSRQFGNWIGSTGGSAVSQDSSSRTPHTFQTSSIYGRDDPLASYESSAFSASPSQHQKCILQNEKLAVELLERIDELLRAKRCITIGLVSIDLKDEVIRPFYNEHADGPADDPSDASLLVQISSHEPAHSSVIIDVVDKAFSKAGWQLRRQASENMNYPILEANSPPLLPCTKRRNTNLPPPQKRQRNSGNRTSTSGKQSYQNSAQQSFASGVNSQASVSRNSGRRQYPCHMCRKVFKSDRKWQRHYDIHFPAYFWACEPCGFVTIRPESLTNHFNSDLHETNVPVGPEFSHDLERNKFQILDGGHECCIYCDEDFTGLGVFERKKRILTHVKDDTPESLTESFAHRCSGRNTVSCGEADHHWRQSKFVQGSRKPASKQNEIDGEGSETQDNGEDDSVRASENDEQLGRHDSTSQVPGDIGKSGARGAMRGMGARGLGGRGYSQNPASGGIFNSAPGRGYQQQGDQERDHSHSTPSQTTQKSLHDVNSLATTFMRGPPGPYVPVPDPEMLRSSVPEATKNMRDTLSTFTVIAALKEPETNWVRGGELARQESVPMDVDYMGSGFENTPSPPSDVPGEPFPDV